MTVTGKMRLEAHWELPCRSKMGGFHGHLLSAVCMCPYAVVKKSQDGSCEVSYSLKQGGKLIALQGLSLNFLLLFH